MNYSNTSELDYEQAKDKALRLLEFRAHSEKELSDKLRRKGAKDGDIEKILSFCREYGFVNDSDYARRKARDLKNLKKYGKKRIASELKTKGLNQEDIETALFEIEDDEEELYPLVRKKLGGNFDRKNTDKCIRYFIYRGYGISDIKRCIERAETDGI